MTFPAMTFLPIHFQAVTQNVDQNVKAVALEEVGPDHQYSLIQLFRIS
jgi:hypothetical protein